MLIVIIIIYMKYRKSKQRDMIYDILLSRKDHPTADDLYLEMKNIFPGVSLGTVYRNLNILVEQGLVNRIDSAGTFSRFDGKTAPHSHFVCRECGKIIDVELNFEFGSHIIDDIELASRVEDYKLDVYGKCLDCSP